MGEEQFTYLYDPELLKKLDASKFESVYSLPVSHKDPGPGLKLRPLKMCDYEHGFLEILSQLTAVGEITQKEFNEQFKKMESCPNTYYVTVIEDTNTNDIVGAGTLLIEWKFIHNCASRGRIEDIVVNDKYRGRQLGKLLIATLTLLAEELQCYKLSLDCKDFMIPFYSSLRFCQEQNNANLLQLRFH